MSGPARRGHYGLADWIVPVHYVRRSLRFPKLETIRSTDRPTLDELLGRIDEEPGRNSQGTLDPIGHFRGRDREFYELERAVRLKRVVVIHGPAGTGKTELAKGFARWWRDSGGVERSDGVLFYSFEPGLPSSGLESVVTAVGQRLFGPEFIARITDAEERHKVVLLALQQRHILLVWDNFESIYSMPDPSGIAKPVTETQREEVSIFLAELAERGRTSVIITSRNSEEWLGPVRRLHLGGLDRIAAMEMADDLLAPFPRACERRNDRAYMELLKWLDGHPLSLRLILPHLDKVSATELLEALRGQSAHLPPGFEGNLDDGRLLSLATSIRYSFDHLSFEIRQRIPALSMFEDAVDERVLTLFSQVEKVPERFKGLSNVDWQQTLQALVKIGLLTALGDGMYGMHPALPAYLTAHWRQVAGVTYEMEQKDAQHALLGAYSGFGVAMMIQLEARCGQETMVLLERQRRTMSRLASMALAKGRFREALALLQPLNIFFKLRGLVLEAAGWLDRCRTATEGPDGLPTNLGSDAGVLWLCMLMHEADRALAIGDAGTAERIHHLVQPHLEQLAPGNRMQRNAPFLFLSVFYHQFGAAAQARGKFGQADCWYRKSLEISEAKGDLLSMSATFHQLGSNAIAKGI